MVSNSIVEEIELLLKKLGAVQSEAQFCREWLGRGEGYMRTLRFTGTEPSAASLAFCADRLERLAQHIRHNLGQNDAYWGERLAKLAAQCRVEQEKRLLARSVTEQQAILQYEPGKYLSNQGGRFTGLGAGEG